MDVWVIGSLYFQLEQERREKEERIRKEAEEATERARKEEEWVRVYNIEIYSKNHHMQNSLSERWFGNSLEL